jgi:RimK family alpha-L-glutamate ligase
MKIIILSSNRTSYEIKRLIEESKIKGIKVETYNYKDISITTNRNDVFFSSWTKKISFKDATVRLWRPQLYNIREVKIYNAMIEYIHQKNIIFLNKFFLKNNPEISNKIIQHITLSQYTKRLINPTLYFESKEEFLKNINKIRYPIIIKPVDGSKWTWVKKINDKDSLLETFKYLEVNHFLFQKYIPNNGDIRIIYIWGKYIGAMMRKWQENSIVNNYSQWWQVTQYQVPKNIRNELSSVVKNLKADIIWIDIIIKKWTYYILEINKNPGFKWFESCTKTNIAEKIITLLKNMK